MKVKTIKRVYSKLDPDYLRSVLDYNSETGVFKWKYNESRTPQWNGRYSGVSAGTICSDGYLRINIDYVPRLAHRIAWSIYYGVNPETDMDHINMDRSDNRIANLRLCDNSENNCNRVAHKDSKCKYKGVTKLNKHNKWVAEIMKDNTKYYLGIFNTPEDAYEAYCKKAEELHGQFARI